MNAGQKIKEKREMLGYSQSKLAEMVGVSTRTIQRFESGENATSMTTLEKIAKGLDLKLRDLLAEGSIRANINFTVAMHDTDLSDRELTEKIGISYDRLNSLMIGLDTPTEDEYRRVSELTGVSVEDLKPKNRTKTNTEEDTLFSNMYFALRQAPNDDEKRKKEYLERLANMIRIYATMSQHTYVMALSSKERPNEYLKFIQNYERLLRLVHEHKDDVINGAFNYLEDASKLKTLIYGDDSDQK